MAGLFDLDVTRGTARGGATLLRKPFAPSELARRVRDILGAPAP